MRNIALAVAFLSMGTVVACGPSEQTQSSDMIDPGESDTPANELEEEEDAVQEAASNAAEEIQAAGDEAEAAVNEAGEAMTESTDEPQ